MTNTTPSKAGSIFYIDLLRCTAAFAVIIIHVLGPFRKMYGEIPQSEWLAAASFNSITRWAVPVFMMISGALLLSSKKEFNCDYYLFKRLNKVALPFIMWTIIYVLIGRYIDMGWGEAWNLQGLTGSLMDTANTPAWYHLWFFYDFIPLYFVVPFLALALKRLDSEHVKIVLVAFALLYLMKWFGVKSFVLQNIVLYSGYLVLGWYLFNRDNSQQLKFWLLAGCTMLLLNIIGTWILARESGEYSSFYMGYKSLNTAIIGGMIFVLAQEYAPVIQGPARTFVSTIAKYSLGIYLIHPILLIPVRNLNNSYYDFWGTNWIAIPAISFIVLLLSLGITILLANTPLLKKLVP